MRGMRMSEMNVPKLRFGEFEGEWVEKKYGDIYSFYSTNSLSRDKLNYEDGDVKNIHYGDIHTKFSTIFDIEKEKVPFINRDVDLSKVKDESYCQEGDLVIADASEDYADIGKTIELKNLNNEKLLAGLHTFLARPNKEKITIGFMGYLLQSWKIRKQVMTIAQGTKVLSLSSKRLANLKIDLPLEFEQQKIANFLTSIDQKINQLTQKKTLLESYKKGVMQKIVSQELRFKRDDGGVFEDWEIHPIGDFIDLLSGFAFKSENIVELKDGIPLLRGINITEGKIRHSEEIDKFYIGSHTNLDKYFLEENDLVISMDGSKVGKNSALIGKEDVGSLLIQRVARIRTNNNTSLSFIYQHINSVLFHNYVNRVKTSSGIPHISSKQIKDFKINFPCLVEQQKIANFLTSLDQKITQTDQQIEAMKSFKKGLLQGMFV